MAKADYKFLTDIDLESNNIVNVSKIIGNDYENISPDLEITTEDKTEGQAGNLLLRAGENETEVESGYVHIYAGTSTEPSDTDANLGIKVLPDKEIQVIDNDITIRATTTTVDKGSSIILSNNEITYHSDEHIFEDALFNVVSTSTDIGGSGLINIHSDSTIDLKSPDTDIIGESTLTLGNAETSNYIEFTKANNITINAGTLNTTASESTTIKTGESTITQTPDDTTIKSNNITADAGEVLKAFADTEILIQLLEENAETSIHITKYDKDSTTGGLDIDSSKIDIDSTSTIDITSESNTTITAENSDLKLESKFTDKDKESSILLNENITVNTNGNYSQTAAGTTGITSTGKITVTASAGLDVIATGQLINIDSNKLDINATESINLGIGSDNNENPSVVIENNGITSTANTQTIKGNSITIQDKDGNNKIELSNDSNSISITTKDANTDKVDITSSDINLNSDKLDSVTKEFNIYLDKNGREGTASSSSTMDYVKLSIDETDKSKLDINVDNITTASPVIDIDSTESTEVNSSKLTLGNNGTDGTDSTLSQIIIRDQTSEVDSIKPETPYNNDNFDILLDSKNASIHSSKYLKIESAGTLDIDAEKLQLNTIGDFNLNSNNIHIIGSDHLHLTNNIPETSCDITAAGIILNKGTTKGDIYINADSLTTTVNSYKLADATDTNQFITLDSNSIKINNSSGSINLPRSLGDFTIEGIQAIKGIAPEISLTAGSSILKVDDTDGISLSANKIITKSDDTQIINSAGNYGLKVEESSNTLISSTNNIIASQINIRTGDENTYTEKLTINEATSAITNSNIDITADEDLAISAPVNFKLTASHVDIKSSNNTAESGITTQNLKVNAVANFNGFAIYWDDDTNSLIFTEDELNWI